MSKELLNLRYFLNIWKRLSIVAGLFILLILFVVWIVGGFQGEKCNRNEAISIVEAYLTSDGRFYEIETKELVDKSLSQSSNEYGSILDAKCVWSWERIVSSSLLQ